jgi:tellurite resistance protein TerC
MNAIPALLSDPPAWIWIALFAAAGVAIAFDLGSSRGQKGKLTLSQAIVRTGVWFGLAATLFAILWTWGGAESAQQYASGYLIELSLSADNVFLFVLVFERLQIAEAQQHRVLFWGVLGAVTVRTIFLVAGIALIERLHWILYLFGLLILVTAIKLLITATKRHQKDVSDNPLVRRVSSWFSIDMSLSAKTFFVKKDGKLRATPLFLALIAVELADFVFALDSLPAVLGVTKVAFLAVASNLLAILGLRSLYFVIGGAMKQFKFLNASIALILLFIGIKMLVEPWIVVPTTLSLFLIGCILFIGIALSLIHKHTRARA